MDGWGCEDKSGNILVRWHGYCDRGLGWEVEEISAMVLSIVQQLYGYKQERHKSPRGSWCCGKKWMTVCGFVVEPSRFTSMWLKAWAWPVGNLLVSVSAYSVTPLAECIHMGSCVWVSVSALPVCLAAGSAPAVSGGIMKSRCCCACFKTPVTNI